MQIGVLTEWAQDVLYPSYQHHAQIGVSLPGDMQLRFALSGVPSAGLRSYETASIAALSKPPRIFQCQDVCQRNQRSNSLDLLEQCHLRIALFGELLDLRVVLSDSRGDRVTANPVYNRALELSTLKLFFSAHFSQTSKNQVNP